MTSKSETDDALAKRIAETLMSREGTAPAWNLALGEVRTGYAQVSMKVRPDMLNGHGTVHGGLVFALADTAFAYASNSRNVQTVSAQASIIFLGSAVGGEILVAEAHEDVQSGRNGVYSVSVKTVEGRPIAQFLGLSRTLQGAIVEPAERPKSQ